MTEPMHNPEDGVQDDILPVSVNQPGWFRLFFATFGTVNPIQSAQAVRKGVRTFLQGFVGNIGAGAATGALTGKVYLAALGAGFGGVLALVQNALGK